MGLIERLISDQLLEDNYAVNVFIGEPFGEGRIDDEDVALEFLYDFLADEEYEGMEFMPLERLETKERNVFYIIDERYHGQPDRGHIGENQG